MRGGLQLALTCALVAAALASCGRSPSPPRPSAADARESAYRSNNRGVGLLEQRAFDRAIAAFQDALRIEPTLRLARANLALALFYAQRTREAATMARAAQADYPEAPEPAYLLGLIARADGEPGEAIRQFDRVLRVDPDDPGARVNMAMAMLDERRYGDAASMARAALEIEPYNATAAYTWAQALTRGGNQAAGAAALQRFEQLRTAAYAVTYSQDYLQQGRYAEAVASSGLEPGLITAAMPPVTFADATTPWLGTPPPSGSPAAPIALADVDADGDLDLIAGGASLRVFRNDRARLADVTATTLAAPATGVTGVVAGDMNNDTRTDLVVASRAGIELLIQRADGRFPAARVLDRSTTGSRTVALADVDHDGDLDIVAGGRALRLLRNNGDNTFLDVTAAARISAGGVVSVAVTDFDNRRDADIVAVASRQPLMLFRNLRTGAFEDVGPGVATTAAADFTSLSMGDVNKDGFTDLLLGRSNQASLWMMSDRGRPYRPSDAPASTRGTRATVIFDYDNDGLLDLFVATAEGTHLLRNVGTGWQEHGAATAAIGTTADVASLAAGDIDADGDTDIVAALGSGGIRAWRNDGGNANKSARVALTGRASNRQGVGARVETRAGSLYQRVETTAASPAVTPADITFGLGSRAAVDSVRVLWPSGVLQTEFPEGAPATRVAQLPITELDRTPSSCPFLYAWNGERFEFVTDFMGGGEMGYLEAPPNHRNIPDPDEYVRITDRQLRERNGRLELRVTNELEETLFLDHLALGVVSHPSNVEVFPDEGMRLRPQPFALYAVRDPKPPRRVTDEHGHDVTAAVSHRDRRFADDFDLLDVRGYAREHSLVLDLPPGPLGGPAERTALLLTGWTDYAFSTDNVTANQRGLTLVPPTLQVEASPGIWTTVTPDVGIPVGRPQTLVLDVTPFAGRRVRIATSMRVYWDEVLIGAASVPPAPASWIPAAEARLQWRGFSRERLVGTHPLSYDYARVTLSTPWKLMPGRYTREGDVRELLQAADDRFVISRPGDEIVLSFDAAALPPLAAGMRRTFLLYSVGFSKEMDLHSASPDLSGPLPFRGMTAYPYTWPEKYPHAGDVEKFHTRVVTRAIGPLVPDAAR